MKHSIHALPLDAGNAEFLAAWPELAYVTRPLVFVWDDETGDVSGPSADLVRGLAQHEVRYGPPPGGAWTFSPNALKSRSEMAVLIASEWELPSFLAGDLPTYETPAPAVP